MPLLDPNMKQKWTVTSDKRMRARGRTSTWRKDVSTPRENSGLSRNIPVHTEWKEIVQELWKHVDSHDWAWKASGLRSGALISLCSPGSDQAAAKLPCPRHPSVISNLSLKWLTSFRFFLKELVHSNKLNLLLYIKDVYSHHIHPSLLKDMYKFIYMHIYIAAFKYIHD